MMPTLCFIVESGADVRLIEGFAERFELEVLARRIEGGVEISRTPASDVPIVVGPSSRAGFARMVFRELRARRGRVDCVIVQGYGAAALAANVAGRLFNLPTLMLVCSPVEKYYLCRKSHGDASKPFRQRELFALNVLARINAHAGQKYLVLSRHLAEVVRGHGTRREIAVVPVYGVDTRIFAPASEPKAVLKERLGLPASGSLIFFSSRVAPEKDAGTLLAAVRALLNQGRDIWLLHRSGGHREFLEDAARFGVSERIIATDAVHPHGELADDYRASDLCVQASREEGLGFSPLEALACGVPVVAARVGGLRETIIDGETGWSYQPGDAYALARCIGEALDERAEAARRTENGRALVGERYEREVVFAKLTQAVGVHVRAEGSLPDDGQRERAAD